MKSLIKKIGVFVFAFALMAITASTVLANGAAGKDDPGPGWDPPRGNKPGESN